MNPKIIAGIVVMLCLCSSVGGVMMMGSSSGTTPAVAASPDVAAPPAVAASLDVAAPQDVAAPPAVAAPPKYRYVRIYRDKDGDDHWMNLVEVEVFSGGVNVASSKTVTASSVHDATVFPPSFLVDGNKTNMAHTNNGPVEWFLIDLGQDYEIEKVVITNRLDCCQARLRNTKIQLSKAADMSSPKESPLITRQQSVNAIITWDVKTNMLKVDGYEWGLMDPNVEHNGWTNDIASYDACRDLAKTRGHLAWGVQTGYHPHIKAAGKSIGGCWTRPNLTNFTGLVAGDINHVSGCADPTKNVSSRCV